MLDQIVTSGLAMGAIYALIALGYAFVWNTMAIVNFAAGEFVTFAAYIFVATFVTALGFPFLLALVCAALAMALLGALFSRVVFARLQKQRPLVAIIATVGFGLFLKEMAHILYGPEPLMYPGPLGAKMITLLGVKIGLQQLLILAVVLVLMVLQHWVLQRSMIGKVMRAVAADRDTAALMGIPVQKVLAGTFAYSSVLAALAGILLAPLFFVTTEMGTLVGLKGFVAMIIGGFGSIPGAILGGLLLGLCENLGAYWISSTYKDVIAFGLLLVFLAVRPQGLLPERSADRA
ncbi:MAG: branched-chain amino acid ABC transporter permease [Proteobacteria bacterium]|nr:branched-chain amino acid ABC transporter permease [Pseudomonadota bacterium]